MPLKSYTHSPKSGVKPKSMIMFLHGLGANGADLIDIARYWEGALPDTVFVSPDAPFPCDMAPMGRQWFSLRDWSPLSMLRGVEEAEPILNDFIDRMLEQYDIAPEKLALVGFSQGTMMSLYAGPRRKDKIAGVLGYSGALVGAESLGSAGVNKIPVHLIHGDMDMIVPVAAYHVARATLVAHGFPVSGEISHGLQHSIDEAGIESGAVFLTQVLT